MTFSYSRTETFVHIVKPLYSGHHSDLKIVFVVERFGYIKVFFKFANYQLVKIN